jgi:hypothetical protein
MAPRQAEEEGEEMTLNGRKRRCEFPELGLGVHCECYNAIECPAARELARLAESRPGPDDCGRENRCEWKRTSIEGHKAAMSRAEKAEAEVERLRKRLDFIKRKSTYDSPSWGYHNGSHRFTINVRNPRKGKPNGDYGDCPCDFDEALDMAMEEAAGQVEG